MLRENESQFGVSVAQTLGRESPVSLQLSRQKDLLMNKNRFAKSMAVVVGFMSLLAGAGPARAQNLTPGGLQTQRATSPETQPRANSLLQSDFAGLNFTDEQKAEIDKIHRETESHKEAVARDDKLTTDQKDAMLLGYTRMEYGSIFRVLSSEQQTQVHQRIHARRAADQAEQNKKQPPRN